MIRRAILLLVPAFSSLMIWRPVLAQESASVQIAQLQNEVQILRSEVAELRNNTSDKIEPALVLYLFAGFCALWAQNTGRNAWLWFFLGALCNGITVLALLYINAEDRSRELPRSP